LIVLGRSPPMTFLMANAPKIGTIKDRELGHDVLILFTQAVASTVWATLSILNP